MELVGLVPLIPFLMNGWLVTEPLFLLHLLPGRVNFNANNPHEPKRILPLLRPKHYQSLAIAFLAAFGTLVHAQTAPNLPGTISSVALSSGVTLAIPGGVAVDQQSNLYISDTDNHRILKVTPAGVTTVYAGTGTGTVQGQPNGDGGAAASATLNFPQGIAVAANGDLYITEPGTPNGNNGDVRKVTAASGIITTVASGLNQPFSATYDDADNALYIAVYGTPAIAKVSGGTLNASWFTNGLLHPSTVAYANGYVYVVDTTAGVVEKVNTSSQATTTVATGLSKPWGVALDPAGDVYVSLYGQSPSVGGSVLMINPATGGSTPVAGSGGFGYTGDGGSAIAATLKDSVTGVAIAPDGSLYIDDGTNNAVRKVSFPASTTGPPVNNIPGCTVISFSAGPNPIYTEGTYGITSILANVTCPYEVMP